MWLMSHASGYFRHCVRHTDHITSPSGHFTHCISNSKKSEMVTVHPIWAEEVCKLFFRPEVSPFRDDDDDGEGRQTNQNMNFLGASDLEVQ